jgi:peptide/nickel transport system substrate-binding protein
LVLAAVVGLIAALLAACSSSAAPASSGASGVIRFAETPGGGVPTWIFPLFPPQYFTIQEQSWFEYLMWPPLYQFGEGSSSDIDYATSLGNPPVYSDNDTKVTITLKHWKWSNGKPVTTRDITFWLNLFSANKQQSGQYTPGGMPDNLKGVQVQGPYQMTFTLNKPYSPTYFTDNQLSNITAMPQSAWDKTSASGPVGNYDTTPAGAVQVFNFLTAQSKNLKTYATNPLWKVVDGPWRLNTYTLTGEATFTPNHTYSGPNKPKVSEFEELPYSSEASQYNALRGGLLDVGFVPATDAATIKEVKSLGYNVVPWKTYGFNSLLINFNNPNVGPTFRQLYVRQALEEMIDQTQDIKVALDGFGAPTNGPVVNGPASETLPIEQKPLYPYDPAGAKKLLASHGWTIRPNSISTCTDPGTAANQCGPGVQAGAKLDFNVVIYSGQVFQNIEMQAFKSAASSAGVDINISQVQNAYILATSCTPSQAACSWEMSDFGGYPYTGGIYYPIGTGYFDCNAPKNHENYCSTTEDQLDQAAEGPNGNISQWETYVTQNLPMLWIPLDDFKIMAVSKKLTGVSFSNRLSIFPQDWASK